MWLSSKNEVCKCLCRLSNNHLGWFYLYFRFTPRSHGIVAGPEGRSKEAWGCWSLHLLRNSGPNYFPTTPPTCDQEHDPRALQRHHPCWICRPPLLQAQRLWEKLSQGPLQPHILRRTCAASLQEKITKPRRPRNFGLFKAHKTGAYTGQQMGCAL